MADDIPRRVRVDLNEPAELSIRNAVEAVESMGADVRLTEAVMLLDKARNCVADFIDGVPGDPPADPGLTVIDEISLERERQIIEEGWTPSHDDEHFRRELAKAAAAYCLADVDSHHGADQVWPFDGNWRPKSHRENLIRAGALIVAELERIDRANTPPAQP